MSENEKERYCLSKENRIKHSDEFKAVFDQGVAFRSKYFIAFVIEGKPPKVGFTIKRGVGAVRRNRLRRILRELWRRSDYAREFAGHVVLMVKEEAEKVKHPQLKNDFEELLLKLKGGIDRQSTKA